MMMTALTVGLLVAVGLVIVQIRKIRQDQEALWLRLNSISLTPGWIRVADDEAGEINIKGGSLWLRGPHGYAGPELTLRTVPGTVDSYPYDHFDGRVSQHKRVRGGGFDIVFDTPTLPDMPLPPRIRLEFRDDTLTIRTWHAKVETAEWQTGDGY